MKAIVLLGFAALLAIDTAQQLCIKFAGERVGDFAASGDWVGRTLAEPLLYLVLLLYLAAFLVYSALLRVAPVGPSYAAMHGHVVTVLLVSILWLGETITLVQGAGAALIVAGIGILAATEKFH